MVRAQFSIRSVLLFGFGGLLVIALGIILALGFVTATRNTFSLLAGSAQTMVNNTTHIITSDLKQVENQARWISEALSLGHISLDDEEALQKFLLGSLASTPDITGMGIVDEDNNLYRLSKNFPTLRKTKMDAKEFDIARVQRQFKSGFDSFWDTPFWLPDTQQTVINLRTIIPIQGGKKLMLGQLKSIRKLSENLSLNQAWEDGTPFVIYDDNYVLAHPNIADNIFTSSSENPLPRLNQINDLVLQSFPLRKKIDWRAIHNETTIQAATHEINDEEFIYLYQTLPGIMDKPLTIGVYFDDNSASKEIERLAISFAIAAFTVVIALIILFFMSKKLQRPIARLARASQHIATNQLDDTPELPDSRITEFNQAAHAFNDMVRGLREREKMRGLFGKMLPERVAEAMLNTSGTLKPQSVEGTVLFCDLEGFTSLSEKLEPETVVDLLNNFFTDMVEIIEAHGGVITQFQGDAILAVFNVPIDDPDHAIKTVQAGNAMLNCVATKRYMGHSLKCRIGINTGPMVAGNSRMNYTVHGDAVNTASRLESMNKEFGSYILISETTQKLAPDFKYKKLGDMAIRGKEKSMELFTIVS